MKREGSIVIVIDGKVTRVFNEKKRAEKGRKEGGQGDEEFIEE